MGSDSRSSKINQHLAQVTQQHGRYRTYAVQWSAGLVQETDVQRQAQPETVATQDEAEFIYGRRFPSGLKLLAWVASLVRGS